MRRISGRMGRRKRSSRKRNPAPGKLSRRPWGHIVNKHKKRDVGVSTLYYSLSLSLISVRVAFALLFARSNGFRI